MVKTGGEPRCPARNLPWSKKTGALTSSKHDNEEHGRKVEMSICTFQKLYPRAPKCGKQWKFRSPWPVSSPKNWKSVEAKRKRSLLSTSYSPAVQTSACLEMCLWTRFSVLLCRSVVTRNGVYSCFIASVSLLPTYRMWRTLIGQRVSRESAKIQTIFLGTEGADVNGGAVCSVVERDVTQCGSLSFAPPLKRR